MESEPIDAEAKLEIELQKQFEPVVGPSKVCEAARVEVGVVQQELYSGPLPHPEHLVRFEQTPPG
jgi:hypothetical protein